MRLFVFRQTAIFEPWINIFHCALKHEILFVFRLFTFMFLKESLPHLLFVVIKETKLGVVNLFLLVVVDLIEKEAIVGQCEIDSHFVHTCHKLSKVEGAVEVFVEPTESLCEAFVFLLDPIVYMLQKHVYPTVLLNCLHHGQSLKTVLEVLTVVHLRPHQDRAMLKDVYYVF